ncbi:hypothetical protein ACHWQZ_G005933 [Mnemiopsis leidyi]
MSRFEPKNEIELRTFSRLRLSTLWEAVQHQRKPQPTYVLAVHQKVKNFQSNSDFAAHSDSVCPVCDKVLSSKYVIKAHIKRVHQGEKPYKCPTCNKCFTQKHHLRDHEARSERRGYCLHGGADILQFENSGTSTTDVSSTQVSCPYCNKMLSSRSLSRHIDNVHRKSKPHLCKKCLQSTRGNLKHHISAIHLKIKPFECHKLTQFQFDFVVHNHNYKKKSQRCKRKAEDLKCPYCERSMGRKHDLKRHILNVHENIKPFKCPNCTQSFARKQHYVRHMERGKTRHGECLPRDFLTQTRGACSTAEQCPYCSKTISSRSNLKKHIRSIHQQLRPFQCDECKQTFAHHHHLKAHRRAAERKGRCFAARKTTEDAFKFLFLE